VGTVAQFGNRQVPSIAHPNDLDPEVRKDAEQIPPPLPGAVVPSIGVALDREDPRNPHDIRMSKREKCVEVAPVESLDAPPVKLHVLLRHRPRSISLRSAAFHVKRDSRFSSKAEAVGY